MVVSLVCHVLCVEKLRLAAENRKTCCHLANVVEKRVERRAVNVSVDSIIRYMKRLHFALLEILIGVVSW